MSSLLDSLDRYAKPAKLFEALPDSVVRCLACAHTCTLSPGKRGICMVRWNKDGVLYAPSGYVSGAQADPIEKKPFFNFLPGNIALTFGMLGCNFHCSFCQNWLTTQVVRDATIQPMGNLINPISPRDLVEYALFNKAKIIASSYNEPLISSEWAVEIFSLAKKEGLRCVFVSNGYATPDSIRFLQPYLDGYKIDLKTMQPKQYRALGGDLNAVLDTIRLCVELGLWVEVVTLVIPDYNDSTEELWEAARFLVSISSDIPWHVTAFHPDYNMQDRPPTSSDILQKAADIGLEAGLHHVYAGNISTHLGSLEDTLCPNCHSTLVRRRGFRVLENRMTSTGLCPQCSTKIAGVW